MKAYMKQHGDTVAGKKIELITRDTGGSRAGRREALRAGADHRATRSQFLAGFGLTPNAMAVAPVATEAKVPMIIMQCGHLGDHHALAVYRARVDDDSAGERADGGVGAEERDQAGVHGGGRLRSGHRRRRRSSPRAFKAGGGESRGQLAHAAAEPGLLGRRSSA